MINLKTNLKNNQYESSNKNLKQPRANETLQGSFDRIWNQNSKGHIPQRSLSLNMNNTVDVIDPQQFAFEDGKFRKLISFL